MMQTFVNADGIQSIDFNHEVITEEYEADNWEEIDKNDSEDSSEQNGSAVLCHWSDDIQQSLLTIDYIKKLQHSNTTMTRVSTIVGKSNSPIANIKVSSDAIVMW